MEVYLFSLLVVLLVFTGATGGLGLLIFFGTPKRRPSDASHLNLPPPANFQETIEKLGKLGFRRLGEIYTRMPLSMSPGPTWIFTDSPMTTQAEILEITPGVFYTTIFNDGAVVETGFPQGENISAVDFLSQTVTTHADDAYHQHQLSLLEFQKDHGAPQPTQSMDEYLYWDGINRSRHARRKMRRVFIIDLVQVLALFYGILISIIVWLWWQQHASVPQWMTDWDRGLFILLAPAFAASIISTLVGFISGRQSRKRPKK